MVMMFTFGSPCQNVSAIGDGKGLQGGERDVYKRQVSYLRAKKKNDTDRVLALYGSADERYW